MRKPTKSSGASMIMKRYGYSAAPGARPGSIRVPEGAIPPKIRVTCYDTENLTEYPEVEVSELKQLRGRSLMMWIDIVGMGDAELSSRLAKNLVCTDWHWKTS